VVPSSSLKREFAGSILAGCTKTFHLSPLPLSPHRLTSYFDVWRHLSFHENPHKDIATRQQLDPPTCGGRRCNHNSLLDITQYWYHAFPVTTTEKSCPTNKDGVLFKKTTESFVSRNAGYHRCPMWHEKQRNSISGGRSSLRLRRKQCCSTNLKLRYLFCWILTIYEGELLTVICHAMQCLKPRQF
jgi:hypothetical protein